MPPFDWQKVMARFDEICFVREQINSRVDINIAHHPLAFFLVDLVADDDLYLSISIAP
jgi:hypothetical protein